MGRELAILCGGVKPGADDATGETLTLNVWRTVDAINVSLPVEHLKASLLSNLSEEFLDLMEIAAYVYAADQAATRGGKDVDTFGGYWRRTFRFHVPVRNLDLWNSESVKRTLCSTLGFLSDDSYEFRFYPAKDAPQAQPYLTLGEGNGWLAQPDEVMLFSGGLDSLSGAIEEILVRKKRMVLVNHRPTPKLNGIHRELERQLAVKAGELRPLHVPVSVFKNKEIGREHTQRSRSFLYMALGAAVARMFEMNALRFYENGVVSLNLPVCEQLIGGRATRTTHPRVLRGFQELLTAVNGKPFVVSNPFFGETKGEIIQRILRAECGPLITTSRSCAHTWEFSREHPHCGTCSQCIDRRIATIAAKAEAFDPAERYKVNILTESLKKEGDRILLADYVERANSFRTIKDVGRFIERFPDVAGALKYVERGGAAAAEMMLDLYSRHASEVREAVKIVLARYADEILARTLPGDCLVRIVCDSNAAVLTPAVNEESPIEREGTNGNGASQELLEDIHREVVAGRAENRTGFDVVARGMEAVAKGDYELRQENDDLRRLRDEGYFKFALRVDSEDFVAFAVIMALGNRKAAADHLEIPHRSFYDRVDKWESRGREYKLMARYVEWRKRNARQIKVRLDDSLQSGESGGRAENPVTIRAVLEAVKSSEGTNYPDLLGDIFGALKQQNATNWPKVRDEVLGLIKEELPQ